MRGGNMMVMEAIKMEGRGEDGGDYGGRGEALTLLMAFLKSFCESEQS
jgi:hypothetical protein